MAKTTKNGIVYDNGKYLGSADIVYGGNKIGKNQEKGLTQNLDSQATTNSQPTKDMNAGSGSIKGANPNQPSINNATRREKYAISTGNTVPESTKVGAYDTVSPTVPTSYYQGLSQAQGDQQYTGLIKKLPGFSYGTMGADQRIAEIQKALQEEGIDAANEMYGQYATDVARGLTKLDYTLGALKAQKNKLTNTQAYNLELVETLARETWMGLAMGESVEDIAKNLGQDTRVIQKIANGEEAELLQLTQEYEEEQMRSYLRNREDMDIDIARNITQYNNLKTNLDYQFNSSIQTLKRNLFDSQWTAKGTAAGLGMSGTKYLLDRIEAQYSQQMGDIQNTYNYQSANAQLAINNALEDYAKNIKRRGEDYATNLKGIQQYVRENFQNVQNNIGLTLDQQTDTLLKLKQNVEEMKANAMMTYISALEDGNTTLANVTANAYGLNISDLTSHRFTSAELGRTSSSTIGNDTNNLGHILASDDGTRIGTYTSPNGYTYNVYATREDGLLATQGLLERAYYGLTLQQAAQKWIGKGKDISAALSVIKSLGLNPNAKLSSENVRKFMEAIGRREGTIKSGETLDNWLKGGKDLSSYGGTTALTEEEQEDYQNKIDQANDMLTKLKQFKKEYNGFNPDDSIFTYLGRNVTTLELRANGIKTMGQLFTVYTDEASSWYSRVNALVSGNPQLGNFISAKRTYQQIKNLNFINNLIDAKSKGATFGNLTEQEGERIVTAYNKIIPGLPAPEMNSTIDEVITDTNKAINKLSQKAGININSSVAPDTQGVDINSVLGNIIGVGSVAPVGTGNTGMENTGINIRPIGG